MSFTVRVSLKAAVEAYLAVHPPDEVTGAHTTPAIMPQYDGADDGGTDDVKAESSTATAAAPSAAPSASEIEWTNVELSEEGDGWMMADDSEGGSVTSLEFEEIKHVCAKFEVSEACNPEDDYGFSFSRLGGNSYIKGLDEEFPNAEAVMVQVHFCIDNLSADKYSEIDGGQFVRSFRKIYQAVKRLRWEGRQVRLYLALTDVEVPGITSELADMSMYHDIRDIERTILANKGKMFKIGVSEAGEKE